MLANSVATKSRFSARAIGTTFKAPWQSRESTGGERDASNRITNGVTGRMPTPPSPRQDQTGRGVALALSAVVTSFVIASVVVQSTSAQIESLSETIVSTSAPSIERLAELRSLAAEVELMLSQRLQTASDHPGTRPEERGAPLAALNRHVESYLTLRVLPGEQPFWRDVQSALVRFDETVQRTLELIDAGRTADARREFVHGVQPAGQKLLDTSLSAIEFHARTSRGVAAQIRDARRHSVLLTAVLTLLCMGLGVLGVFLVARQSRRQRAMVDAYTRFQEARANELEQFAGRVAHDIRNPLSAAQLTADFALSSTSDTAVKALLARILRSLSRANAITSALLEFARSGARPDPGARTDPAEVLRDISGAIATEAEQLHIDFRIETVPPVLVACSTGVYLSLVGNLLRNAIKYMGDSSSRRITVRVRDEGTSVRTEVTDTGPGISAESLPALFDPYFRAVHDRGKDGLGLGLATVKKLAEGHHGSVGAISGPGTGSTFWFLLPRAGSPSPASDVQDRLRCLPARA